MPKRNAPSPIKNKNALKAQRKLSREGAVGGIVETKADIAIDRIKRAQRGESLGTRLRNSVASLGPSIKKIEKAVNPKGTTSFPKKK